MNKSVLTAYFIICSGFGLFAQIIPNAGFESWDSVHGQYRPSGWLTTHVSKTTDSHSGSFALSLERHSNVDIGLNTDELYLNGKKPAYLNGYYKGNIKPGHHVMMGVQFRVTLDEGERDFTRLAYDTSSVAEWTPFHIKLSQDAIYNPTLYSIYILAPSDSNWGTFLVDDLTFGDTPSGKEFGLIITGNNEITKQNLHSFIYPNPSGNKAHVNYTLPQAAQASIRVYNLTGSLVQEIIKEKGLAGVQEVELETSILSEGLYFYTISGDGFSETNKFSINK